MRQLRPSLRIQSALIATGSNQVIAAAEAGEDQPADINLGVSAQAMLVTGARPVTFDTTTAELGLAGPDHIFLAIKTLGWLAIKSPLLPYSLPAFAGATRQLPSAFKTYCLTRFW
jgi:hypothetical protein